MRSPLRSHGARTITWSGYSFGTLYGSIPNCVTLARFCWVLLLVIVLGGVVAPLWGSARACSGVLGRVFGGCARACVRWVRGPGIWRACVRVFGGVFGCVCACGLGVVWGACVRCSGCVFCCGVWAVGVLWCVPRRAGLWWPWGRPWREGGGGRVGCSVVLAVCARWCREGVAAGVCVGCGAGSLVACFVWFFGVLPVMRVYAACRGCVEGVFLGGCVRLVIGVCEVGNNSVWGAFGPLR